jgi:PIN domain nuclease of toxin-antitoxin system
VSATQPGGAARDASYLLDTHIWLWYLIGSTRLPRGLRSTIRKAPGKLWISPISVWELGVLESRGRVRLEGGLRLWSQEAQRHLPLHEASLTSEVAATSCELELHCDPADRFLAASAIVYELTLLTVDERLRNVPGLASRSN